MADYSMKSDRESKPRYHGTPPKPVKKAGKKWNTWERVLKELEGPSNSIQRLERAVAARKEAKQEYNDALAECVRAGLSQTKMARAVGVTEAAIRQHIKRNNLG